MKITISQPALAKRVAFFGRFFEPVHCPHQIYFHPIAGECFYYGNGVGQNYEQARFWYEKAAAQDYVKAMVQLGNIAQKGLDGADYETAFQLP